MCQMAVGCWLRAGGCWRLLFAGCLLLAAGCWMLTVAAACRWLLIAGCWSHAAGCWMFAAGWLLGDLSRQHRPTLHQQAGMWAPLCLGLRTHHTGIHNLLYSVKEVIVGQITDMELSFE